MQRNHRSTSVSQDRFAEVALPVPVTNSFTYQIPKELHDKVFVGCRVEVPFGRRVLSGVVTNLASDTKVSSIKPIRSVYETYLSDPLLKLTEWMASYYGCSVGEAAQSVLPPLLKRSKRAERMTGGTVSIDERSKGSIDTMLKRAPRQLELIQSLRRVEGAASVTTVVDEWGFAMSQVKSLLEKGIVRVDTEETVSPLEAADLDTVYLNRDQRKALAVVNSALQAKEFTPILLHGVTGSGKTELYIRAAQAVSEDGGGSIVLVPEISLLPQAIARYKKVFGDKIAIIHSRLTGPERFAIWEKVERGECRIVLGPRSAVFSPIKNLRLIVVDEEQDDSYKQEDKPRYHARNIALMRGKFEKLTVLLGSATPSVESLHHAQNSRYSYAYLPERAGGTALPNVDIVDMRDATLEGSLFSSSLLERIEKNVNQGHQTILFLNKRGHARFVQCNACGWVASCENCDISLVYHRVSYRMRCHFCGYGREAITRCPECASPKLYLAGAGTQRVELDLRALIPGVNILRMDADTTSGKEGHRRVLERFVTGDYPILIGTQMVAKGHHFPRVNLVGVLNAEESLNYPDFRSAERTFRQLVQVAGRAGRAETQGEVVVQTYMPEHHVFTYLQSHDYNGFMKAELKAREELNYPPYSKLILASCSAKSKEVLGLVMEKWAVEIRRWLDNKQAEALGPAAPIVGRVKNRFREQILIKGRLTDTDKRVLLGTFGNVARSIRGGRSVDLHWDVDPETFY